MRAADFDDPASLEAAWSGASTLVLVPSDAPGVRRRAQHAAAVRAATASGVARIVYLGVLEHGAPPTLADDHLASEVLVQDGAAAWTILRNGIYADGLVERALAEGALSAAVARATWRGWLATTSPRQPPRWRSRPTGMRARLVM